jgi:hypothetical protein
MKTKKKNLKEKLNQLPRIKTDLPIYQDNLDYSQLVEKIRKEVKEHLKRHYPHRYPTEETHSSDHSHQVQKNPQSPQEKQLENFPSNSPSQTSDIPSTKKSEHPLSHPVNSILSTNLSGQHILPIHSPEPLPIRITEIKPILLQLQQDLQRTRKQPDQSPSQSLHTLQNPQDQEILIPTCQATPIKDHQGNLQDLQDHQETHHQIRPNCQIWLQLSSSQSLIFSMETPNITNHGKPQSSSISDQLELPLMMIESTIHSDYSKDQLTTGNKISSPVHRPPEITIHGHTSQMPWTNHSPQLNKHTKLKETFKTVNKKGNISRITSVNSPPLCHSQDCKTAPPSELTSAKDLTPKSDTKHSDKTHRLWQNGKLLQDLPGELQKNRVELDLETCLTDLLNQLQSEITKAKEMETTPDTTISTTILLLKETSGTWTLTKSTNNSTDLLLTKMEMTMNPKKKSQTMNQKKMMMMMKSTNSTHKDKETQTEVLTNTKMHSTTSSTMSSQTNSELHLSKEYASSARRKDISITIVRQGRFSFTKEEQEIWDNNKPTTPTNPDLQTKAKEERLSKTKGKTPMPWYTT